MTGFDVLDQAGFILSVVLLGYCAYSDIRTREVPNIVWIFYLPLASIVLALRLILKPHLLALSIVSIIVMTSISLLMFYLGLFGGADSKAFICLSVALPTHPFEPLLTPINPVFPLSVFYNAYLLSASIIFYAIIKNLDWKYGKGREFFEDLTEASLFQRAMALVTGYKANYETLRQKVYLYPMEEVSTTHGYSRRLKLFTDAEADRDELVRKLGIFLNASQKEEVWVTPGIPLLLFVWSALVLDALLGDLLLWAVSQIFLRLL